jgi:hypothetical protein
VRPQISRHSVGLLHYACPLACLKNNFLNIWFLKSQFGPLSAHIYQGFSKCCESLGIIIDSI